MQTHSDDKKKIEHLNTQKTQPPIYHNTRKKELKNLKKLEKQQNKIKEIKEDIRMESNKIENKNSQD